MGEGGEGRVEIGRDVRDATAVGPQPGRRVQHGDERGQLGALGNGARNADRLERGSHVRDQLPGRDAGEVERGARLACLGQGLPDLSQVS